MGLSLGFLRASTVQGFSGFRVVGYGLRVFPGLLWASVLGLRVLGG